MRLLPDVQPVKSEGNGIRARFKKGGVIAQVSDLNLFNLLVPDTTFPAKPTEKS